MRQQKLVVDHMCMDGQVCMAMAPFARATGSHYYFRMRPGLASGTTNRQAIIVVKSISNNAAYTPSDTYYSIDRHGEF